PQLSCPPCESPTRPSCPPCPECHACPECPTTDVPDVGGEWPSSFPDNGTQPQGGTSTAAGATLINELKDGHYFWMFIAIASLVLNALFGLCFLRRKCKDFQNRCHLPQNDRPYHSVANGQVEMGNRQGGSGDSDTSARECPQGQMNNNVEGGVEEEANRSGRSSISAGACGRGDDTAQTISEKSSLFQSNGAPSGVADVGNSENETAPKRSVKVAGVCHRTPDNHHTTSHSSPPVAPQPRQGDSVQGSTPSTQPLLASMTQQDKTLASGMPTGAYQQNVPASTVSEGTGEDQPYNCVANGQVEMRNRQGGSGDSDTSARECPQGQMNNNVEGGVEEEANRSGRSSISAGACGRGDDTAETIS
ncbi:uncharacterized protein LOC110990910, partial [Acanthaster planci]|uniref:Uncharacterized protein LOC110990910 n=1 Tax=Acanthaster planci TaxID=133434 RepID=A0A8B8A434_ACAPL